MQQVQARPLRAFTQEVPGGCLQEPATCGLHIGSARVVDLYLGSLPSGSVQGGYNAVGRVRLWNVCAGMLESSLARVPCFAVQ